MLEPVTWSVGRQNHLSKPTPEGLVPGVDIPVTLSTGETFVVFVPMDTYAQGVDTVRGIIQAEVDRMVGVARLSGEA